MYQVVGSNRGRYVKSGGVTMFYVPIVVSLAFVCENAIECHLLVVLEPVKYVCFRNKSLRLCCSPLVVELPMLPVTDKLGASK